MAEESPIRAALREAYELRRRERREALAERQAPVRREVLQSEEDTPGLRERVLPLVVRGTRRRGAARLKFSISGALCTHAPTPGARSSARPPSRP